MNKLFLTIAALSLSTVTSVSAQNYEQDYDVVNKENLKNSTGFIGLGVGGEISRDNTKAPATTVNAQSYTNLQNQTQAQVQIQQPAAPMQPNAPLQQTVAEVQIQQPTQLNTVQSASIDQTNPNIAMQSAEDLNAMQPAAGNTVTWNEPLQAPAAELQVQAPEVIMLENTAPQTVFKTRTIIGNTDTGVNADAVLKALENN